MYNIDDDFLELCLKKFDLDPKKGMSDDTLEYLSKTEKQTLEYQMMVREESANRLILAAITAKIVGVTNEDIEDDIKRKLLIYGFENEVDKREDLK